jgi:hypothetical protein
VAAVATGDNAGLASFVPSRLPSCIGVVNHDFCTSSIGGLVAVFAGYADAAPKKQKKPPSAATTQNQPPKLANTYGAGCKNQGAFIVSGTCAN